MTVQQNLPLGFYRVLAGVQASAKGDYDEAQSEK